MNLYAIKFRHYAPKDSKEGIITYLLANDDESVYNWFRSEPKSDHFESIYNSWMYKDDPENEDEYDENFKNRIVECRGDMYDDESEVSDLYYGATQYGWELIKEGVFYTDVIHAQHQLGIHIEDATL